MDSADKEKMRAVKQQAIKLTEATFLQMEPKPLRPVEKVAPIVYALLIQDIDPKIVAQALVNARAHTENGIQYALTQIMPPTTKGAKGARPQPWSPPARHEPNEAERTKVAEIIAETRRKLHGGT